MTAALGSHFYFQCRGMIDTGLKNPIMKMERTGQSSSSHRSQSRHLGWFFI
jgi:hypothetical protein